MKSCNFRQHISRQKQRLVGVVLRLGVMHARLKAEPSPREAFMVLVEEVKVWKRRRSMAMMPLVAGSIRPMMFPVFPT